MSWDAEGADFEYDDWSPYAVHEGNDVLVVKSEGDYFFALRIDDDRWQPLPMESDRPEDFEQLWVVVGRLLDVIGGYREQLERSGAAEGERSFLSEDHHSDYRQLDLSKDGQRDGTYTLCARQGERWRRVEDYDTLWGLAQQIASALLRSRDELADNQRRGW